MKEIFEAKSEEDLGVIAKYLHDLRPNGAIVLLDGELGAGKTAFVRAFVSLLGGGDVSSPTFAVMNEYPTSPKVFHYDFYNFGTDAYFEKGMFEYLEEGGYHFLEWADEKIKKFLSSLGIDFVGISIKLAGDKRIYEVSN
ncbi:MAG: tRNA (adenosine(37)-N6)-threonylcarbamoyltransferase complex ATPase subunit type 1 TsaE [Campylobacterales bacterium]|nr:tRNA (adenosine(37)-N6)-threonylcarbamoyltransferase complex ATPase subunit type 1 TsaE [Campylobacterales bacterium]